MAHINITYHMLELLFKTPLQGRHITKVELHPFKARTIMARFHGDDDDPILLTDEVTEGARHARLGDRIIYNRHNSKRGGL